MTLPERFMAHVARRPDGTGCWDWTGAITRQYGKFKFAGRSVLAHRLSLEAKLGRALGRREEARHGCDRPCCVNPGHLLPGSRQDNERDKIARGRRADLALSTQHGERHGMAKLNSEQVFAIRRDPRPQRRIAAAYGISQANVSDIRLRKLWAHLP